MFRTRVVLATMAVTIAVPAQSKPAAHPIAPGAYCIKEPMTGYTGTGHDIALGDFIMWVEVSRKGGRYAVSIANRMPDNPQIVDAETNDASVLPDGSLAFSFTDGWENEGRARVYPNGKVVLVMTKEAETLMNQIGRTTGRSPYPNRTVRQSSFSSKANVRFPPNADISVSNYLSSTQVGA